MYELLFKVPVAIGALFSGFGSTSGFESGFFSIYLFIFSVTLSGITDFPPTAFISVVPLILSFIYFKAFSVSFESLVSVKINGALNFPASTEATKASA